MCIVYKTHVEDDFRIHFTKTAADDHTWQEETGWNHGTVGGNGKNVPAYSKRKDLSESAHNTLVKDISDEATFGLPE